MKIADIEVTLVDHMGTDLSVVNAARVSFAKESDWFLLEAFQGDNYQQIKVLGEQDRKLINYLAKHKHYSPFNHTFLTFRIKAPIFVARQLVKHEYMPWNEVSRRYVDNEPEFYFPECWRAKAENVKQGSDINSSVKMDDVFGWGVKALAPHHVTAKCLETYNELLSSGVCAEQARMVLPQNTMTEWVWSGTLKAFHKMLVLRLDPHTQAESRTVAELIAPAIEELFPVSFPALMNNP